MEPDRIHGLLETVHLIDKGVNCYDVKCVRVNELGDTILVDLDGRVFCEGCGKSLRYFRKKAAQRGEAYEEGAD